MFALLLIHVRKDAWMYNKYKTISALFGNESVADAENISGEASHTKKIQGLAWLEFLNFLYVLVSWGGWTRTPAPWIRQSRVIFIIFRVHLLFRPFYMLLGYQGGGGATARIFLKNKPFLGVSDSSKEDNLRFLGAKFQMRCAFVQNMPPPQKKKT